MCLQAQTQLSTSHPIPSSPSTNTPFTMCIRFPILPPCAVLRSNPWAHPTLYKERHIHRQVSRPSTSYNQPRRHCTDFTKAPAQKPNRKYHLKRRRHVIQCILHYIRFPGVLQQARPPCLASSSSIKASSKIATRKNANDAARFQQKKASANPVVTGPNSPAPLLSTQNVHGPRTDSSAPCPGSCTPAARC
ncbi:hypothetical protein M431DRAFT_458927 [Trichoderma harzianum CBS 226.95]|uniref:Uncharacterized protein n=1 Tax=Trichoderma harzianum CBS 226.95 TaxID=983964 RepID=A0A2T4A7X7_TRIHA|nr:hypothetical protein M431DRAFT_458927 [Trichoderma harzianum CBS 226.95]PTB53179.1 hypothetical protein M431DRAFT_458927 [Trichoderma harzianum CBS 226.95]